MIKKIKIIFILLITSIVSAQKESFNVELNQIRFKSNTMQDLVLENIKDYKITHKIEPQIIIFNFYEKTEIQEIDGEMMERKKVNINVTTAVSYFSKDDINLFKDRLVGGTIYNDKIIILQNFNNSRFEGEPFFFVDSKKINLQINFDGNMTQSEKDYEYFNKELKFIKNIDLYFTD